MEATVCRKRDLSSHFSPQTLWFSEKLRETHWRRFTAAHKRTKLALCRREVLSAHFRFKFYPPRADLNSTLSAQRHTGSAAKAAAEFRYKQGGGICTFCRGSERGDAAPRVSGGKKWTTGWSRPLGPFFRAYRAGKGKQPQRPLRGAVQRHAGELCFLWFGPKEVPARHEGYRPALS